MNLKTVTLRHRSSRRLLRWRMGLAGAAVVFVTALAHATQTLTTASQVITIDVRCEEGELGCTDVHFSGVERKTGRTLSLRGEEVYRLCADGETPCQFLHYRFEQGDLVYLLGDNGLLHVKQGEQVLIEEQGEWDYGQ